MEKEAPNNLNQSTEINASNPASTSDKSTQSVASPAPKKSHKVLIIVLIILGVILGIILLAGLAFKNAYNSLDPKLKQGVGQVYECSKKCAALPKNEQDACAQKCVSDSSLKDYVSPAPTGAEVSSGELSTAGVYTNAANGFSYTPPAGWEKNDQEGVLVSFINPKNPQTSINIVSESSSGLTLSKYSEETKKQLMKAIPSYKISNEQNTTINGVPAYLMDGAFSQDEFSLVNRQAILIKDGKAYVITATSTPDAWAASEPVIDASFKTFKLN